MQIGKNIHKHQCDAMPQGSCLITLCFVALINDLDSTCLTHRFVDDTTLSEILQSKYLSYMQTHLDSVSKLSEPNTMKKRQQSNGYGIGIGQIQ